MKAMPMLTDGRKYLELRNAADEPVIPATELKSGEDARAAAKRAVEEFFGMDAPEDAFKEGFQGRVSLTGEVVAVYPVDASKMDMALLRPAEDAASWGWKDLPEGVGDVVALGFPRNQPRLNSADLAVDDRGTRAGAGVARNNRLVTVVDAGAASLPAKGGGAGATREEALAQYHGLVASLAEKAAGMHSVPAHERGAREAEMAQEADDLRLLAADLGIEPGSERLNSDDQKKKHRVNAQAEGFPDNKPTTARALIKQNDGTIIAARQRDGRSLLPGGHLEAGETAEDAAARELQEELGVDIRGALTGETYDFSGEDGSSHRVFVVDAGKIDLSKLNPGDDVEDAEIVNSPFTDSHGQQHPPERTNAMATCAECGHGDGSHDGLRGKCFEEARPGDTKAVAHPADGFKRCSCQRFVRQYRQNAATEPVTVSGGGPRRDIGGKDLDGNPRTAAPGEKTYKIPPKPKDNDGGDVQEIQRHVEGIEHELGELDRENGSGPLRPGDRVRHRTVGWKGTVDVVRGDTVTVKWDAKDFPPAGATSPEGVEDLERTNSYQMKALCEACAAKTPGAKPEGMAGAGIGACDICGADKQANLVGMYRIEKKNADISKSEIPGEIAHHERKGMPPKQAVAAAFSEAGASRNNSEPKGECQECGSINTHSSFCSQYAGMIKAKNEVSHFDRNREAHMRDLKIWEQALEAAEMAGDKADANRCRAEIADLKSKIAQGKSSAEHLRANSVRCPKCDETWGEGYRPGMKCPTCGSDVEKVTLKVPQLGPASDRRNHIEELPNGKFRLLSHDGKNLGTFDSHAAAAKHEGEVEWFKEHKNDGVAEPGPSSPPNILEASY